MATYTLVWTGDTDDIEGVTALFESDTSHVHSAYGLASASLIIGSNEPIDLLAEPAPPVEPESADETVTETPVEEVPDASEVQPDTGLDGTGTPTSSQ